MAEGIKKVSENVIIQNRALIITNPLVPDNDAISIGALQSNPETRGLKIKTSKGVYSKLNAAEILEPLSITTELIANFAITNEKLAKNSVGHDNLQDNCVCEWKLQNNSVTRDKIKNEEVIQGKLAIDAVLTKNLVNQCVTNQKIAINTIENDRLLDHTITNKKIAQGTIINESLANNSISSEKIKDNTITNNKYASQSIYGDKIKNQSIQNIHLSVNSVNSSNILNGAVTSSKLADRSVFERHIENNQISSRHLDDGCVTSSKLATDSVTNMKIRDKSISVPKLGDDVIELIGNPIKYDKDYNVNLVKNLNVQGNIVANGTIRAEKIYNAVFMDLAEAYTPHELENLLPGDIVEIREDNLLHKANVMCENKAIVGVVSNEYAQCFGATQEELQEGKKVAVGMIGKVHVNVIGSVTVGDYIHLCDKGVGISKKKNKEFAIGKALETNTSRGIKKVLCLIYPN